MNILNNFELYLSHLSPLAYVLAFIGGVLASFTPCVYPLIPISVGYIASRSLGSKRRGLFLSLRYVLGMAVMYSILGGVAASTGKFLGKFTQNPLTYILVGNICLVFALSLLGLFDITLPNFLLKLKNKKNSIGFLEPFFVGAASALIMSPCTTPILGAIILFVALEKDILFGAGVLFAFAYGMGALFIILGTFSGLLSSIPKLGNWLVKIKKVFGLFLLLAAQFYFFKAGSMF